jgi:methylmalonyl-CoA epimerase
MLKLNHIGIAVKSLKTSLLFYQQGLELNPHIEEVPAMKVKVAKLTLANTILELIEPLAGEEAITKFLEKRGQGIHHICLEVDDIKQAMQNLQNKGYQPIYPEPKTGAGGHLVNFLAPKDTAGVLIEILQI